VTVPAPIPCLDLTFAGDAGDLPDRVALALDDFAPAAIHETGDARTPVWRVFLSDPAATGRAAELLASRFAGDGLRVARAEVPDEDWAARTQAHLTRITVGELVVAPPWDTPPDGSGTVITIFPSTGFGTGHHQTTRLCLGLLQQVRIEGRRVVDLGTGSGVLALAAWRLGAAEVEGIDYEADALDNARENLRLNGAGEAITLRLADLRVERVAPADLVVANLTGALLVSLAPAITDLVRPGGTLVVSGFMAPEVDALRAVFEPVLTHTGERGEDAWRALRFDRAPLPRA
jgi:ribosomal protein L11 methyltransferase